MKRRFVLGIMVGTIAFARVAEELWFRTDMMFAGIIFWSMAAYIAGIVITYAVTDKFRIRVSPAKKSMTLVTLDREEWYRGQKETKYTA